MRIQNTCYNNSFQANINSPRLRFKQADFFVKIRGYGTNTRWAKKTKETADTAVNMARKNTSAENILKYINNKYIDHQIIILTCTNREKEILEKLNIKFNLISL